VSAPCFFDFFLFYFLKLFILRVTSILCHVSSQGDTCQVIVGISIWFIYFLFWLYFSQFF